MEAKKGRGRTSSSSSSDSDALSALSSSSDEPVTVGAVGGCCIGWGWSAAVAARNSAFQASIICFTFSRSSGASSSKLRTSSCLVIVLERRQARLKEAKTHSRWYQRVLPWPSRADGGLFPMRASPALNGLLQSTLWHFERSSQACVLCSSTRVGAALSRGHIDGFSTFGARRYSEIACVLGLPGAQRH